MTKDGLKIILTGATGMVGEGVLRASLDDSRVEEVLVITRKLSEIEHPKLKEIVHQDFFDLGLVEDYLEGYDACFFCAGVSSLGMKEEDYYHVTYEMTLNFAETLSRLNSNLTFCYVSGAGTDNSEIGRMMWARVKGKTENDLQKLPIDSYSFRPAFMKPSKNAIYAPNFFKYTGPIHSLGNMFFPNYFCTTDEVGAAMVNVSLGGYFKNILEVNDIKKLVGS